MWREVTLSKRCTICRGGIYVPNQLRDLDGDFARRKIRHGCLNTASSRSKRGQRRCAAREGAVPSVPLCGCKSKKGIKGDVKHARRSQSSNIRSGDGCKGPNFTNPVTNLGWAPIPLVTNQRTFVPGMSHLRWAHAPGTAARSARNDTRKAEGGDGPWKGTEEHQRTRNCLARSVVFLAFPLVPLGFLCGCRQSCPVHRRELLIGQRPRETGKGDRNKTGGFRRWCEMAASLWLLLRAGLCEKG